MGQHLYADRLRVSVAGITTILATWQPGAVGIHAPWPREAGAATRTGGA
jgi:hypothetical protein